MLVSQLVDKETARPNSILYSNSSYRNSFNNDPNPVQVEPYFGKFLSWINGLSDNLQAELSKFICPLFCHLYLDLLQGSYQTSASVLLKYYQEQKGIVGKLLYKIIISSLTNDIFIISESELCSQVIKEFMGSEVKSRPIIKSFRSSKHKIKISAEAITILKNYLAKHGHVLIFQVSYM